jgi:hypothetical protein
MGIEIVQVPTGLGNDTLFTYQDLLLAQQQDAWTTVVYFPATNDIICEDSVLNPAIQWCAPKAELNPFAGEGVPVVHHTVAPPPPPPHIVTPEPSMFLVVIVAFVIILWLGSPRRRNRD